MIHFADCLGPGDRIDLFGMPWLYLQVSDNPEKGISLVLEKDATKNFIQTMNLGQGNDLVPLLNEIIYRYGPPDPRLLVCEQAA